MKSKKISRFKFIGRLINNRTNLAAKQLADSIGIYQQKQQKLVDLNNISKEYQTQISNINLQVSANDFKLYHRFIDYLDYVIKQQTETVVLAKQDVEVKRKSWIQFHRQNKELKNYIENIEKQYILEEAKKEQKELDTSVTDTYIYRNNTDDL